MARPLVLVSGVALLLGVATFLSITGPPASAQDADLARGEQLYAKHCAVCHGDEGRGDGSAAYLLLPKPRDFTRGEFRVITTRNGVPTDDDLLRIVTNGMPGSAMPPWDRLADADRKLLVKVVKQFWRKGLLEQYKKDGVEADEIDEFLAEDTTPGKAVSFEGEGKPTMARVARGRILYFQACASCHGLEGRGDTTQVLIDSRKHPAPARDFTKGIFKGGSDSQQIYARLRAGMKGTAMPTYGDGVLNNEEAWSVVHFVRTLFPPAAQARQEQKTLRLKIRRVEKLPASAEEWWKNTPAAYVALMPLWWRDQRTEGVLVQAAHDGKTLALRLAWDDTTQDVRNLRQKDFHDGAAVQISWDPDPPFFGMGDGSASVVIWSWKASWQEDKKAFVDLEAFYPHMHLDTYFPVQKNLKAGERPDRKKVSAAHHDPRFLTGWGAKNPMSNPERTSAVEVAQAKGLGTLTTQERAAQKIQGVGTWDRGVWTLELRAALTPEQCRKLSIAFAVWDGSQNDRNGQKSVSIWHQLELE